MSEIKRKPRVVFPSVEAGMGHIMPMKALSEVFRKKYGDKVDIVEVNFFQDSGNEKMKALEKLFTANVRFTNRRPFLGRLGSFLLLNPVVGVRFPCWLTCRKLVKGSYEPAVLYMKSLNADIVFSTHYSTQYYAWQLGKPEFNRKRPISISYCPDSYLHNYYRYPADYTLVITDKSYNGNAKSRLYKKGNKLVKVPFMIRNEALSLAADKKIHRKNLGLPEDKFTIVISEGGYGIGKMQGICEMLLQMDLPITLVPVCGKNEVLFEHFKTLSPKYESVTFHPFGFNTRMLETIASADLYIGKSAHASIAEPTFFGVPSIVSGCATSVERQSAQHFCNSVKSSMKITSVKKIVAAIERFVSNPAELETYIENARADRPNYGAEAVADFIWSVIQNEVLPTL